MQSNLWYVSVGNVTGILPTVYENLGKRFVTKRDWIYDGSMWGNGGCVKIKMTAAKGLFLYQTVKRESQL
jgi:hypothetical protein